MSTTTLYTTLANAIGVSSNNYTTLYNSSGSEIFTQGPYGNANVEAFLNAGSDAGGNTVQGINMSGTLTVGGESNLGNVSNVHITGGGLNYVLVTDGGGNLSWEAPVGGANIIPFLHFDVVANGNSQSFTDTDLELYDSNVYMNVMKNGVNIEPALYEKTSANTLQINILLETGDTIDVLATSSGSGGQASGNIYEVQFNDGVGGLAADPAFTYTPATGTMISPNISVSENFSAANITVTNNANLGNVGNVIIDGGTSGQFLSTDGVGNLTWQDVNITTLTIDVANLHISGGTNGYVLQTDGSGNLSWTAQTGGGGGGSPGGANRQIQYNNSGIFGGVSVMTFNGANVSFANVANLKIPNGTAGQVLSTDGTGNLSWTSNIENANIANTVSVNAQPNITSLGTLTGLTSGGVVNFTTSSNVSLGSNANVHITGGTANSFLSTDGVGNLSWTTVGVANYANFAGQVVDSTQSNITSLGTLTNVTVSGNANVGNVRTDNLLYANGTPWSFGGSYGNSNVANYLPTFNGNLNPNVVTANSVVSGNVQITGGAIQSIKEPTQVVGTSVGASQTIDLITDTVWYFTSPLYNNTTLAVRGNSTVTANTMIGTNESITFSTIFTNSANISLGSGVVSNLSIDGTTQTIHWVGSAPTAILNGLDVYAFTLVKTAANTYTVIGSRGTTT